MLDPLAFAITPPLVAGVAVAAMLAALAALRWGTEQVAYAAVGIFVLVVNWNGFRLSAFAVGDVFMSVAFLAVVAHLLVNRRQLPLPGWLFAAVVGFIGAAVCSLVFPPRLDLAHRSIEQFAANAFQFGYRGLIPGRSEITPLIEFLLSLAIVPLTIAAIADRQSRARRLLELWAWSAVASAAVACVDVAGIHVAPVALAPGPRSSGLTLHPNYLALTSAIALPITLSWIKSGPPRRSALGWTASVILLGGVYASGSRAGTLGALLAVMVTVVAIPRLRSTAVYAVPVLCMVLVVVLAFTRTGHHILAQLRISGADTSGSDSQRAQGTKIALAQIRARPLEGVGYSVIEDAHNIYLQLLAAGGVVALLSFVTFIGGIAASLRRAAATVDRELATVIGIALVVWLTNGVFDNQLADKFLYVVPGVGLALGILARSRAAQPLRAPAYRPAPEPASATGIGPLPTRA